ncbi:MAG: hypothetical protein M3468_04985 [Acidobacteriota bacterium]|nr:hypothetical protein [Acidobacteriota bacterium]
MRWPRVVLRVAKILALITLGAVVALLLYLQTPWADRKARSVLEAQAARLLEGQLSIGNVDGNFLTGLNLTDVVLTSGVSEVVRIKHAAVHYSLRQLVGGDSIVISRVALRDVTVNAARGPDGALNIGRLLRERPSSGRPGRILDIRQLLIENGEITFPGPWGPTWLQLPRRITNIHASLGVTAGGGNVALPVTSLTARGFAPDLMVDGFSGTVAFMPTGWAVSNGVFRSQRSDIRFSTRAGVSAGKRTYQVAVQRSQVNFPELAPIAPGLRTIDVPATLSLTMTGPEDRLDTVATIESVAGNLTTRVTLDSTVPGWGGAGGADLRDFDVSRWLPTASVSRITGHAEFDLLLGLGRHFPRGAFTFSGPHVVYVGYEARDVRARGRLTEDRAELEHATAAAYGAPMNARGWIAIAAPYQFHLRGHARALDLRELPSMVPVPKIQSSLTFEYDARGRFENPYLNGDAIFGRSTMLGTEIAPSTRGSLDTSREPVRYSAVGEIVNLDLPTVGRAFDIPTLRRPEYGGVLSGRFDIAGQGTTFDDLDLRLTASDATLSLFRGTFRRTTFTGTIVGDSLKGTVSAEFERVDPAVPLATPAYVGSITGSGRLEIDLPHGLSQGARLAASAVAGTSTSGQHVSARWNCAREAFAARLLAEC